MKALILAGQRPGGDPLARQLGVPHKALIEIGGQPMLQRVTLALQSSPAIGQVVIATGDPSSMPHLAGAEWRKAAATPSLSVAEALSALGAPLLVTTADHALLDPVHVQAFLGAAPEDCDLAVALVSQERIEARFPQNKRTYLRFRDGGYSGANLFLLKTGKAALALDFWRHIEANRKKPWHIARAFGPALLISYLLRRYDLQKAVALSGRHIGLNASAVRLDHAEAAVDVDKLSDLELVQSLVQEQT